MNRLCGSGLVLAYKLENYQPIVIRKLLFQLNLRVFDYKFLPGRQPLMTNQLHLMELMLIATYQEALYAQVTDKLSYETIGLVAFIDQVKRAANM